MPRRKRLRKVVAPPGFQGYAGREHREEFQILRTVRGGAERIFRWGIGTGAIDLRIRSMVALHDERYDKENLDYSNKMLFHGSIRKLNLIFGFI